MEIMEYYKGKLDIYRKGEVNLKVVLRAMFATILGQYSPTMRMKLERCEDLEE